MNTRSMKAFTTAENDENAKTENEAKRSREHNRTPDRLLKQRILMMQSLMAPSLPEGVPLLPGPPGSSDGKSEDQEISMQSKLDWLIGNVSLQSDIPRLETHMGVITTDIQSLKENSATKTEVSDVASWVAKMELEDKNMKETY